MNKAISRLTITFFSIALMTLAGTALAGPGPGHFRDGPPHHGRGMPGMPVVDMAMRAVMHLDLSDEQVGELLHVDERALSAELDQVEEHLGKFGDKLPEPLREQLESLKQKLA